MRVWVPGVPVVVVCTGAQHIEARIQDVDP